jgi:predicted MFS family arabinose efflux permease
MGGHTGRAGWPRAALVLALVCAAISVHDHPVLLGALACVAVAALPEGRRLANSTVARIVALGGIILAVVAGIVGASYHWSDIAIVAIMVAVVTVVVAVSELAKHRLGDANES